MKRISRIYNATIVVLGVLVGLSIRAASGDTVHDNQLNEIEISLTQDIVLETRGGIADGSVCRLTTSVVEAIGDEAATSFSIITCSDGTIYRDVHSLMGSATGTPPHLMYSNYIGSEIPEGSFDMPGAQRRIMYFDGIPRVR